MLNSHALRQATRDGQRAGFLGSSVREEVLDLAEQAATAPLWEVLRDNQGLAAELEAAVQEALNDLHSQRPGAAPPNSAAE